MNLNTNIDAQNTENFDTEVLIVGAGPTGMIMALELHRYGIKSRLIDRKSDTTRTSNASGIHTRVLELLDKKIVEQLFEYGRKSPQQHVYYGQKRILEIDFNLIDSPYPFVLLIPQNHAEVVLLNALAERGITIEWNKNLENISQNSQGVTAELKTQTGSETIRAKWLVASDGYRSTVRELLGIPYSGEDFPLRFIMIDTPKIHMAKPLEIVSVFIGNTNLIYIPFKNSTRLIAQINVDDPNFNQNQLPDEKIFTKLCAEYFPGDLSIEKPIWASNFFIHQRLARNYQEGRIFLAGDAVHSNSPTGGHGMNAGVQDSINLAWKLAMVIKNQANEKLLNSYEEERRPIAKQIITKTTLHTNTIMTKNKFFGFIRNALVPIITSIPFVRKKLTNDEAELLANYRKSSIVMPTTCHGSLKPGNRIPNLYLPNKNERLFDVLQRKTHVLLDFFENDLNKLPQNILEKIEIIKIDKHNNNIKKLFGCEKGYCLVRPDNYIAYIGENISGVADYFSKLNHQ